jgi:hypothetical protein
VEWLSVPLVPVAVTVTFPVLVVLDAENKTDALAPAATLNGLAGFDVTPVGKPESATCTLPEKPFNAVTERLIAELVVPCCTVTAFAPKAIEKSGEGGGGGGGVEVDPPPHPDKANSRTNRPGAPLRSRPITRPRDCRVRLAANSEHYKPLAEYEIYAEHYKTVL